MESQPNPSSRHGMNHWECAVETEKVQIKHALLDLPVHISASLIACIQVKEGCAFGGAKEFFQLVSVQHDDFKSSAAVTNRPHQPCSRQKMLLAMM